MKDYMNLITAQSAPTMTSREIAELTGKRHPDVKRDIERMLADLAEDVSKFARIYIDAMNREQVEYALDRELTETLLTGYSALLRRAVIARWRELESSAPALPNFNDPVAAARAWADAKESEQRLLIQLDEAAPKIEFHDRYVTASTGSKKFREVCKLLGAKENAFWEFLEKTSVMYRLRGRQTPYANHIDAGRFEITAGVNDSGHAFNTVYFTPKGIAWIAGEWAKYQIRETK